MRSDKLRSSIFSAAMGLLAALGLADGACAADWVVAKSSGQVWIASEEARPVALAGDAKILPGDLVQTGPTGRVLLTRGDERILVAPNSIISLPKDDQPTGFTTILQQSGSIAIEAEKKDHQHFEVQTPYLAAVVKGTSFVVTVAKGSADVRVATGQVQAVNLKSGQFGLVSPGQTAHISATSAGVTLSGQGVLAPVEHGTPRQTSLRPVQVPKSGLIHAPRTDGLRRHATRLTQTAPGAPAVVRITQPIGAAKLDVAKATLGLARDRSANSGKSSAAARNDAAATPWSGNATPSVVAAVAPAAPAISVGTGVSASPVSGNNGSNGNGTSNSGNANNGNSNVNSNAGNGSNSNANSNANNGNSSNSNSNGNSGNNSNGNGTNNGNHFAFGKFFAFGTYFAFGKFK